MEEAISQLEVLGITRTQAKKALARYNNDVSRAADFIFSGNYISDGEENEIEPTEDPNQQSEALAQSLSLEEQHKPIESTVSNQPTTTNPSDMSLVVYKDSKEAFDQQVPEKNDNVKDSISNFSLTWWKNPENPSERKAIDYIPIGLRPPAYSFNYAPIVVQALFHITYFQFAVASFQPTPPNWGQPANYWKGKGEHVPGYITIKKPRQPKEQNEKRLEGYNDIDETFIQEDLAEDSQEEDVEVKAIPKCLQAIGELQKIFAFLGNTKRAYGSVADFTKALNTKSNLWDEDDIYFECNLLYFRQKVLTGE
ncbi:hypothetical protein BY458DRAFT_532067 [Sporodiniella umbellata]|nr:hypothetical protein BY458DRAFT_532067 [Sporodiniella umbellata]